MPTTDFDKVIASPVEAYQEGLEFLRGRGVLNETLRRIAADLERHGIEYSVVGAIAMNLHGYRRFTEDIDLLLSREGLRVFQENLVGLGYRPAFAGATKRYRTTQENVPVEIIIAGEYPGDGLPKSVQFPDPKEHSVIIDGIKTVSLEKLIELKLASGMSAPDRLKDLADVQELIKQKALDESFAAKLDDSVREKFRELHRAVIQARQRE